MRRLPSARGSSPADPAAFFRQQFNQPAFFDEARRRIGSFARIDPIEAYADLLIVDGGAGPYLVISTARWAMDAKDIDALAAKARGLLRAAEKAHAAEESKRRASGA